MNALRAVIVIGVSAFLLVLVGPSMFANPPWPYSGLQLQHSPIGSRITVRVDRGSPAYRVGLRTGDALGCLSLRDDATLFDPYAPSMRYTGSTVSLCAFRGGTWRSVAFVPKRMPPPGLEYGTPFVAALRLAIFALFLFVGCALAMARPSPMTWLFFAYCLGNLPWAAPEGMLLSLPAPLYALVSTISQLCIWPAAAMLALFTLLVPDNRIPAGWRRSAFRIVSVAAVATILFSILNTLWTSTNFGSLTDWIDEAFTALTVLLVVARLATMDRAERARFGWAAFAIMFGIVCNVVRNDVQNNTISIVGGMLTVVMPLCLMYAILRRHVIDVRFVISKGVVYGIITTLVVGIIGIVDWATSAYLSEMRAALAIDAVVTITLGFALHRSYGWVESAVDALLFRKKHVAEAYLRRSARSLLRADTEHTIDAVVIGDPHEAFDLTMGALFRLRGDAYALAASVGWNAEEVLSFSRGHDVVRFLATERTKLAIGDLRKHVTAEFFESGAVPVVAIPIFCDDELSAFALYGLHRDGTQLDPDEIDALEHLCERAAQAYTVVELRRYREEVTPAVPAMEGA